MTLTSSKPNLKGMPAHPPASNAKTLPKEPYEEDPRDDSDPLAPPKELRESSYLYTSETYERRKQAMASFRAKMKALAHAQRHGQPSTAIQPLRRAENGEVRPPPKFGRTDDHFLIVFLRAKKFNVDLAFAEYVNFCYAQMDHAWLKKFDIGMVEHLISSGSFQILPKTDRRGRLVMSMDIKALMPYLEDIGRDRMQDFLAAIFAMLETMMLDIRAQIFGLVIVADLTDCRLKTFGFLSVQQYLLSLELCQHCYPLRASGMYLVHEPWYVRGMLKVMRPFMKQKTKDNLLCFGTSVKQVHKFIPKESLGQAYGGSLRLSDRRHTRVWIDAVQARHR
ncbi:unnamed protein product [Chondrus crispus]|uniref:CRAL-TRIO domain-containing protein n=1 Tax=Chondrus crispus TaxID=2769 RepID=R7QG08_CHOCR|nr:unnamed protein product [Chondrus crispus]CDF36708.1 unnamed protein product [Chondrus crispus]|eukprot:XP_005716527.1 unnamed protein product [Chondrus crispus]